MKFSLHCQVEHLSRSKNKIYDPVKWSASHQTLEISRKSMCGIQYRKQFQGSSTVLWEGFVKQLLESNNQTQLRLTAAN